jgi:hypothetical protein
MSSVVGTVDDLVAKVADPGAADHPLALTDFFSKFNGEVWMQSGMLLPVK